MEMNTGKFRFCTLLVVGLMVFGGLQMRAAADYEIYACENNSSGTLKIVAAGTVCANNETLIHWNEVGPQGPMGLPGMNGKDGTNGKDGPQGPQGLPGPSWQLFDANNVAIGRIVAIDAGGQGAVVFKQGNFYFTLAFTRTGFVPTRGALVFESANCSGQAFIGDPSPPTYIFAGAFLHNADVYVEDLSFPVQPIRAYSGIGSIGAADNSTCGVPGAGNGELFNSRPAILLSNFLGQFQTPFSVRQ